MKNRDEIVQACLKNDTPPEDFNLMDTYCFLCLKQIFKMYYNKQISKEVATQNKQAIFVAYEKEVKQYEFEKSISQEHIQHIRDTENARIKLHLLIANKENKPLNEEYFAEAFNLCMDIISKVFYKEFQ